MPAQEHTGAMVDDTTKAQIYAEYETGQSIYAIAKARKASWNTIKAVLTAQPRNSALVESLKREELSHLIVLGGKARSRLDEMLDQNELKPIEAIALMDRSFQQVRLIQGESTANIGIAGVIAGIDELEARAAELEAKITGKTDG